MRRYARTWVSLLFGSFLLGGCSNLELDEDTKQKDEENDQIEEVDSMSELSVPNGFTYETNKEVRFTLKMPKTIDFKDYRSRFSLYTDAVESEGKQLISGSFDNSGNYTDVFTVPMSQNTLYLKTLVTDSLIPLSDEYTEVEYITIDLEDYYNQMPADSFPIATSTLKKLSLIKEQGSGTVSARNVGLVNGDFSENDFGTVQNWGSFTPDVPKWNYITGGIGNTPMTWYNEDGNGFVGTTDEGMHQYGVCQTFAASPGDMITFNTRVKAVSSNGMHSFYRVFARNTNGGVLDFANLQYSFPAYEWTAKTVVLSMPENTAYCTVEAIGGDWTPSGRILFDNFNVTGITDADGDGVEDDFDDYPNDADKAYDYYYPNETDYGTLAFEDTWPGKGDYDFNDVVVDYKFKQILNANNEMVELEADYKFRASGAGFQNGFGFQMDLDPNLVASVTGTSLEEDIITLLNNGTEAGQDKATIIVADNVFNILTHPGGGTGVNTTVGAPYVEPVSVVVSVVFTEPISITQAGYAPYNPFIIVNGERGKEVHLPGYRPTDLVNGSYFGTGDDRTNLAQGKYYLTDNNLPWGINLPISFDYPEEGVEILEGYIHFGRWAQSRGFTFMDWYSARSGYRNDSMIYRR